jgi:hypothetical protein
MQVIKTDTLNARRMEEQVFAASRADKSETLVRQPFDTTFGHLHVSHRECLNLRQPAYNNQLVADQVYPALVPNARGCRIV